MDGMQKFKEEINRIRALAESPEITIIATGSLASRVLDIFSAQTKLRNVRTVIIDTSNSIKTLQNVQTKVLLPENFDYDENTLATNLALPNADIIVILAALGGRTSCLLAPIIAEIGRKMGCLVIAVPILPFSFEKERRLEAEKVLARLFQIANIVTVIDNDHLPKKLRLSDTPNYTARRLHTLLDTLLPTLPFTLVERLIKEIEEETKKISLQMQRPPPQQIIISASNTEQNPILIEEIVVEKVSGETENIESKIIATEGTHEPIENLIVETTIPEKLKEITDKGRDLEKEREPESPKPPQKPQPEKVIQEAD